MSLPQHPLVIRRDELQASRDASAIVAEAREQASAVLDQARRRGFDEGAQAASKVAAQMLEDLAAAAETYWSEREEELVTVALAVAHRVIAQLPSDDILRGLAETALAEHRHDTRLILHTDPHSAAALGALLAGPGEVLPEIRSDPTMQSGRIVLAHARGLTEAGLLDQFRAMVTQHLPP